MKQKTFDVDCVIIGVNAKATLKQCIESVIQSKYEKGKIYIYYVDGGSTDRSVEIAEKFHEVKIIEIKQEYPSPGAGRNAGWKAGLSPFVQFLDSDTLLDPNWIKIAIVAMSKNTGAIRGKREEMHPEASVFNWIGNQEWNAPPGECDSFGGDVLVRRSALEETGGYDEILVGGEDPELSQRIRLKNWKIVQLDELMTKHDLAMTSVSQYWKRGYRTGYGYAALTSRFLSVTKGFWFYESIRIFIRGGGFILLSTIGIVLTFLNLKASLLLAPALLLLFYPRLFRIPHFMITKGFTVEKAKTYAWHCALIVIPEFFGILRFFAGALVGYPLRNKRINLKTNLSRIALLFLPLLLSGLITCTTIKTIPDQPPPENKEIIPFVAEPKKINNFFATPSAIENLSKQVPESYLLGSGDVLKLNIWSRKDISDPHIIVGPDGVISVARIGNINVAGRTREDVANEIKNKLSVYYENPEVNLSVKEYKNNKAFVLGRVANPGVITFPGYGTLLEALALAGGLPVQEKQAFLTKCAIIRGKDLIIWIDLKELLQNGNMALNARIQNNDVIFIPESETELVYIMGEVINPGAIRLKSHLTYMDALMMAGGPSKNANLKKTYIIRSNGNNGTVKNISLQNMLRTGDQSQNFLLKDNDIIYVAEKGVSKFNYALRQLMPALKILDMGASSLERFGVMQELRKQIWGQQGFVKD